MMKTVGVCGYAATGSSAPVDLLHEFDETLVLDAIEFRIAHLPDGLEDLEYHLMDYHANMVRVLAIRRFRELVKMFKFKPASKKEIIVIADEFLKKIIQFSWMGHSSANVYTQSTAIRRLEKIIHKFCPILYRRINELFLCKLEFSVMPEDFDKAARSFIADILSAMSKKSHHKEKEVIVLDQPFPVCNPVKNFKFFENPRAIIVDRDPRDHYLFNKFFLYPRGMRVIPCDNVENYIRHFRLVRRSPLGLRERKDIIFLNFEELVYDYENTVQKIAGFAGVTKHIHKGKYFKPSHSRNNTQLFKKYIEAESDIKKIERELPEYIFPFENYPDIDKAGGMFYGSQRRKMH